MKIEKKKSEIGLDTPIQYLKGVGPILAKKFQKLGLETAQDLIFYYPRRYDDYTNISKIGELGNIISNFQFPISNQSSITNTHHTIKGTILGITNKRTSRRGFTVTEAVVEDGTGTLKVVWFNQPFLLKMLPAGRTIILNGKVTYNSFTSEYVMESPNRAVKPCIVPIYGETAGLSSYYIHKIISIIGYKIDTISEYLPEKILKSYDLIGLKEALRIIHFPDNSNLLHTAERRIAFDELFFISLKANLSRESLKKEKSPSVSIEDSEITKFVKKLPFKLTDDQRKSAWQIIQDMKKNQPMNRLLNGDVGSGKTIVAVISAYIAIKSGFKVLFMVPTSILAVQHFETLTNLFKKSGISVGLYTRERKDINSKIKNQKSKLKIKKLDTKYEILNTDLIVGTQALIQKNVEIENIGLVIVDEQHRFGVLQRQAISQVESRKYQVSRGEQGEEYDSNSATQQTSNSKEKKSINHQPSTIDRLRPHFLSMTATPIPRTMHLALFGDLDVSIIKELPKDRKEIKTRFVQNTDREKAYQFIGKQIESGRQVFVICPLIEEKDKEITNLFEEDRKSVMAEYKKLKEKIFPNYKIVMLHGKMKGEEKDKIMDQFSKGLAQIMVSTSVVEVGIDIPNATVMMIEDADRFGLAQIHQFRGRVGRGMHQSYCFLFSSTTSPKALKRLESLENVSDGFRLAEIDLETRGPGELFGIIQSGEMGLKMASMSDQKLIEEASSVAKSIVETDPELKNHPLLRENISSYLSTKHME